jgi:hypothetical protein
MIVRCSCAVRKTSRYWDGIAEQRRGLGLVTVGQSSGCMDAFEAGDDSCSGSIIDSLKELPTSDTGLSVFEFFSGIGGMRLALPESVQGLPIKRITAFDLSEIACQV